MRNSGSSTDRSEGWTSRSGTLFVLVVLGMQITKIIGCETLPSSIHIIKEIYQPGGQLERTCEGEVAVSKCEGSCISRVRPSAISHTGFYKDCQCCRETTLRARAVTLSKCYDPNGKTLTGDKENYVIQLKEPADCKCFRCGDMPSQGLRWLIEKGDRSKGTFEMRIAKEIFGMASCSTINYPALALSYVLKTKC